MTTAPSASTISADPTRTDRIMNTLAVGRILLGVSALLAPARLVGTFGMRHNPELNYMTRIYGGRAIALGAGYLTEPKGQQRRWHGLGLFVDTSDTLTAVGHLARRDMPRPAAGALCALTGTYAVIGALRLAGQRA